MLYVALGDSITAGESATSPASAYPSMVVRELAGKRMEGRSHVIENAVLAEPGWTGQDLMGALYNQPHILLAQASYISVWVGGDNLVGAGLAMLQSAPMSALRVQIAQYGLALESILAFISRYSKGKVIVCTQYNPFPNSPVAVTGIEALNGTIIKVASGRGVGIAPVHAWFEGHEREWIAGYQSGSIKDVLTGQGAPVHPNNRGHRAIATGLTSMMA